jgi:UDP-N-acetylglucosamine 2-epimerase (non-hydrolysing)
MHVVVVFGTRPEIIKLAPVAAALVREPTVRCTLVHTGQHDALTPTILDIYGLQVHHHLAVMHPGQTLSQLGQRLLAALEPVLDGLSPDAVVVAGDTLTAEMAGLAAFWAKIPVAHVEAGLRTYNPDAPFPEESARRILATLARWHFAPSVRAAEHLKQERVSGIVTVSGNPVVDALYKVAALLKDPPVRPTRYLVLATIHRRENHPHLSAIFGALARIARHPDTAVMLPVHPNPTVVRAVRTVLEPSRVRLLPPLDYLPWLNLMRTADLVITDSGGIQEEAPVLGVPLLVAREETERLEVIEGGYGYLVGHDPDRLVETTLATLAGQLVFRRGSPYGDGHAGPRIAHHLVRDLAP